MKKGIAIIVMIVLFSCTNNAGDATITVDSAANAIIDSNAAIPDTNAYFNQQTDSTNMPDEPGPTITSADTTRR